MVLLLLVLISYALTHRFNQIDSIFGKCDKLATPRPTDNIRVIID